MYIDGDELVNNDGLHGDREICKGTTLTAGLHEVKVRTHASTHARSLAAIKETIARAH